MTEYKSFLKKSQGYIEKQAKLTEKSDFIDNKLFIKHNVNRGLRDINGNGVVCGLTEISEINAFKKDSEGNKTPCDGELFYRGINVETLIAGYQAENRFGFEEVCYLLIFGKLPSPKELDKFNEILIGFRTLPKNFFRDVSMKATSTDMMNMLSRCVLTMYSYDDNPDDISLTNILRQVLGMVSQFPTMAVYGYNAFKYYIQGDSLHVHKPLDEYSIAQNILHLLRPDNKFTDLEAKTLDMCLTLQAEHGGGNNSSFAMRVISSSATDTYSAVSASLASLKGGRHGGANIKVVRMFEDLKANITNESDGAICDYFDKVLKKEAFDHSGIVYGMGHAVYSKSDPRAEIMKKLVEELAVAKGMEEDYFLYKKIERLAPEVIADRRQIYKGVPVNVDFYSGFLYKLLDIPPELFTPIFAIGRMPGWGSHRLEEMANNGKIIRPAYIAVGKRQKYKSLDER